MNRRLMTPRTRKTLGIAGVALGMCGVLYSMAGYVMAATFTESATGVVVYLLLIGVSMLVIVLAILTLRNAR